MRHANNEGGKKDPPRDKGSPSNRESGKVVNPDVQEEFSIVPQSQVCG